jgi:hypothetical protein
VPFPAVSGQRYQAQQKGRCDEKDYDPEKPGIGLFVRRLHNALFASADTPTAVSVESTGNQRSLA